VREGCGPGPVFPLAWGPSHPLEVPMLSWGREIGTFYFRRGNRNFHRRAAVNAGTQHSVFAICPITPCASAKALSTQREVAESRMDSATAPGSEHNQKTQFGRSPQRAIARAAKAVAGTPRLVLSTLGHRRFVALHRRFYTLSLFICLG
jgi:hypothetical protein